MAWELEALIARLLMLIACAGEQGCSLSEFIDVLRSPPDESRGWSALPQDLGGSLSEGGLSTIWTWIAQRDDISVGPGRKYNHLSLSEALGLAGLPPLDQYLSDGIEEAKERGAASANHRHPRKSHDVRICASEQTMWEAITGHSVDYKRVPRSEWLLLLGIASTKDHGILQGDLCRLVEQDKRSVPKRTDALVKKGYITKRTTLVRGTKTSKLWLKAFTPPLPRDTASTAQPETEINMSRQVLAANLDPVPWHARWTGESVDYIALLTTIMAVCKEWDVMRLQDLKSKLGVLGMRWQMKVVSKVCRFLNARDAIRYVAARLDNKVYKDCIRFHRDLDAKDWSIFLSTGKRPGKPSRYSELFDDNGERADVSVNDQAGSTRLDAVPPWSIDQPLPMTVAKAIMAAGEAGLTNPDIYGMTLGASFTRYLSSMTIAISTPGIQPAHLKHLQVKSEHFRNGKVASYRYSMLNAATPPSSSSSRDYGFSLPTQPLKSAKLDELCRPGPSRSQQRGRPRKQKPSQSADLPDESVEERETAQDETARGEEAVASTSSKDAELRETAESTGQRPKSGVFRETVRRRGRRSLLVVRFVTPSGALRACLAETIPGPDSVQGTEETTVEDRPNLEGEADEADKGDDIGGEPTHGKGPGRGQTRGRGRGGTRGRGRRHGRATGDRGSEGTSKSKSWICDKCGGQWKNDIGLKYHLEKSRTSCNPSWDPSILEEKRKRATDSSPAKDATAIDDTEPLEPRTRRGKRKLDEALPSNGSQPPQEVNDLEESREPEGQRRPKYRKFTPQRPAKLSSHGLGQTPLRITTAQPRQMQILEHQQLGRQRRHELRGGADIAQDEEWVPKDRGSLRPPWQSSPSRGPYPDEIYEDIATKSYGLAGHRRTNARDSEKAPSKKALRHEIADRVAALILEMLQGHEGVLPGGESLWRALTAVWDAKFPTEPMPKPKDCQWALSRMLKMKTAVEHWHGFQAYNGLFSKCQIITLPHLDAFSPESLFVLEKIKQAHPQMFVPEIFSASDAVVEEPREKKDIRRGRRLLAGEVADLDAPVYAAQLAAKRGPDVSSDTQDPVKRRKYASSWGGSHGIALFHGEDEQGFDRAIMPTKAWSSLENLPYPVRHEKQPLSFDDQGTEVQFLVPNTFLEDDPSPGAAIQNIARARMEEAQGVESQDDNNLANIDPQLFEGTSDEAKLTPQKPILDRSGSWPALDSEYFEGDKSFTMQGWMPDAKWLAWEGFMRQIKQHAVTNEQRSTPTVLDVKGSPRDVRQRLKACLDQELALTTAFIRAKRLAAGPHNLFINLIAGSTSDLSYSDLTWPSDGQMTLESANDVLKRLEEASQSPSPVVSLLTDDDDDYDDDDDVEHLVSAATARVQRAKDAREILESSQKTRIKRVALATRTLSAIPRQSRDEASQAQKQGEEGPTLINEAELLAAFIAIRTLLGGADKAIDWGLLLQIYPEVGLEGLRRFWSTTCKEQASYVQKFTGAFQTRLIEAFENDELPIPDYDNLLDYDWSGLIEWTMRIPHHEGFRVPQTRQLLDNRYTLEEAPVTEEDWREKFFHVQTSIFSRFEAVTSIPGAVAKRRPLEGESAIGADRTDLDVAKSWIKSLCCTEHRKNSPQLIKEKFLTLSEDAERRAALLKAAVDHLTRERVINKSKKPPLGGRPYKLSEWYISTMNKLCQRSKYEEAAAFKAQMDTAFRAKEGMEVPYTLNDGAMMALTNLNAAGRVRIVLVDVPNIPFGFEPGNYESRKFPKSYYHFRLKAVPTEDYRYNQDIEVLEAVRQEALPSMSPRGEIPQWVDFLGDKDVKRWLEVLGAFCFAFATRGSMTVEGICSALKPVLEEFEARLIVEWGMRTGVLQHVVQDVGITVGEWWWLAVPWHLVN